MMSATERMRREIARRVDAGTLDKRSLLYRLWLQRVRREKETLMRDHVVQAVR